MRVELTRQVLQEIHAAATQKAEIVAGAVWTSAYDCLAQTAHLLDTMKERAEAPKD